MKALFAAGVILAILGSILFLPIGVLGWMIALVAGFALSVKRPRSKRKQL